MEALTQGLISSFPPELIYLGISVVAIIVAVIVLLSLMVAVFKKAKEFMDNMAKAFPAAASTKDYSEILEYEEKVNGALADIRLKYSADRVMVARFHNGVSDLAGNPLTKVSITHEIVKPNIIPLARQVRDIPVALYSSIFSVLRQGVNCIIPDMSELETTDHSLYQQMYLKNDIKSFYGIPFLKDGKIYGVGVVEYCGKPIALDVPDIDALTTQFQVINGMLQATNKDVFKLQKKPVV